MIDSQQTGKNLMILRVQKGLSQQGLAELCNVTHQAVSKWENGAALPDMQTLLFLSKFYGVAMEELLTGSVSMDVEENEEETPKTEIALAPAEEEKAEPNDAPASPPALGWDQIVSLAPFASRETVEKLVLDQLEQAGGKNLALDTVTALLPFVGQDVNDRLLDRCMEWGDEEGLIAVAPFVSQACLERAVEKILTNGGRIPPEKVCCLAPFLPRKAVDRLILGGQPDRPEPPSEASALPANPRPREADSPLLRIARKAIEDGNLDWLSEHFGDLDSSETEMQVCSLLAQANEWDFLTEQITNMDSPVQEAVIRLAIQGNRVDFLTAAAACGELSENALRMILDYALRDSRWDLISAVSDQL